MKIKNHTKLNITFNHQRIHNTYQMLIGESKFLEDCIQTASSCTKESTRGIEFRENIIH